MKNDFYLCDFHLLSSSGGKLDLKIDKIFSKTPFYRCSESSKMIQWLQLFDMLQTLSVSTYVPRFSLLHVLFGSQVKYAKNGQKFEKSENVVTYSSYSLLQECLLEIHIKTFHLHHKIQLCTKKPDLPDLLFCQLLTSKYIRRTIIPLF